MKALSLRLVGFVILAIIIAGSVTVSQEYEQSKPAASGSIVSNSALKELEKIALKGRAPKSGYQRAQFGNGWTLVNGCDTRNIILKRDLKQVEINELCKVISGVLDDPYSGKTVAFLRGARTSDDIQIDHVVALSDAWQKGAQQLTKERRIEFANDPLELMAVDGSVNQEKGNADAATWLPPNKSFRCSYVARQIAVKSKYDLWMTHAEYAAIVAVLSTCPNQTVPSA